MQAIQQSHTQQIDSNTNDITALQNSKVDQVKFDILLDNVKVKL